MKFNQALLEELNNYKQFKNQRLHQLYHPHQYNIQIPVQQNLRLIKKDLQSNSNQSLQKPINKEYLLSMHAKQYLNLKQQKASQLKNHSIFEKSKRVEATLSRWNQKIIKKKSQNASIQVIQQKQALNIDDKNILISSISPKNQKYAQNEQVQHGLKRQQRSLMLQPDINIIKRKFQSLNYTKLKNKTIDLLKSHSIQYLDPQQQVKSQQALQKSAKIKMNIKNQRINQARYMKYYIQQQKLKQFLIKQSSLKKLQKNKLKQINKQIKSIHQTIDDKYHKNDQIKSAKSKNKLSLPSIKASNFVQPNINQINEMKRRQRKIRKDQQLANIKKTTVRQRQKSMFQILKEEYSLYD